MYLDICAKYIETMETADWKKKSLQRSRENKQLKKRIKELTTSRDEWKEKSGYHKKRLMV